MPIPCPRCQHPVSPGATSCASCGASLLLEVPPASTEPTCAVHPTLRGLAPCERCGAFACARCLRASSRGEVLCERCFAREPDLPMPWDGREKLGTFTAFWKTLVQVMLHPDSFATARPEGSVGSSLLFVLLCSAPACFMAGLTYLGIFSVMRTILPKMGTPNPQVEHQFQGIMVGLSVFVVLVGPLLCLAATVMGAGLGHLVLRIGGITRGYPVTLRALALSQAPWVLGLVPFIGTQVAPFWVLVACVFAYRGLHRTSWGVALAGVLVPTLATCCLFGGSYLALLALALSSAPHH